MAEEIKNKENEVNTEVSEENAATAEDVKEQREAKEPKKEKKTSKENEALKKEIEGLKASIDELNDKYLRTVAEYENYRKRAVKEKENIYGDAFADAVKEILPVLDNLERAVAFADSGNLAEGVNMILNMFKSTFEKMGIEEIATENAQFDPNFHNAVMHIEDDSLEENVVVETFSKGYKKGDRIIRYAMVKVAN